jgi:hypothetical protein
MIDRVKALELLAGGFHFKSSQHRPWVKSHLSKRSYSIHPSISQLELLYNLLPFSTLPTIFQPNHHFKVFLKKCMTKSGRLRCLFYQVSIAQLLRFIVISCYPLWSLPLNTTFFTGVTDLPMRQFTLSPFWNANQVTAFSYFLTL